MTVPHADQLVEDYLARLERAASMLPPGDRADLIDGIREHIDTALATGTVSDEAGMRTLLDRLGEPEAIAVAARENNDLHVGTPLKAPKAPVARLRPGGAWRSPSSSSWGSEPSSFHFSVHLSG